MNAADRFFAKVQPDGSGCLLWVGARTATDGYGRFGNRQAHRWLWERVMEIPEGLVADHLCRNPSCVRPSHIEFVTPRENIIRGVGPAGTRARAAARKTCAHGHAWTDDSTYIYVDKIGKRHRMCTVCMADRRKTPAGRAYYRRYARIRKINARLRREHSKVVVLHGMQGPIVDVTVTGGDTQDELDEARVAALDAYRATLSEVAS